MQPAAYCFHKTFDAAPAAEFRVDRHYLLYALEGTMRLEAMGQLWTLPPARAALIKADHPIRVTMLTRVTTASVLFDPPMMAPPDTALSVFDMSPLARELVRECRGWGAEAGPLTPYARQIFDTLAAVALDLARQPSPCVMPRPSTPALARALDLTEQRAHDSPTFDAIARDTGQSPRALSRRFSAELGMTWREALRRIRMIRAVEALAMTQDSVARIAMDVGYTSLSGFNAAFRAFTGQSPTAYRATFNR